MYLYNYTKRNNYVNQIFLPITDKKHLESLREYLKIKDTQWKHEEKLWLKVKKYQKIFKYIPGILCVCVWNSLAMNAAHRYSDIDLFIITKTNRIWIGRILLTLLVSLLWQRKTVKNHAGKFCLSFFITEKYLSLENIAIENDIYLQYWVQTLVPIVNKNNTFEKFIQENEKWCSLASPHSWILSPLKDKWEKKRSDYLEVGARQRRFRGEGKFLTRLWNILEKLLKKMFLPRTKKSFQKLWKPFWVVITDDMLKFHDRDRRKEIRSTIFF